VQGIIWNILALISGVLNSESFANSILRKLIQIQFKTMIALRLIKSFLTNKRAKNQFFYEITLDF
jgi:hypothetical protein